MIICDRGSGDYDDDDDGDDDDDDDDDDDENLRRKGTMIVMVIMLRIQRLRGDFSNGKLLLMIITWCWLL